MDDMSPHVSISCEAPRLAHSPHADRRPQQRSRDRQETGSLDPTLHRLEAKGWIAASWFSDQGKRARHYSLTVGGGDNLTCQRTIQMAGLLPRHWIDLSRSAGSRCNASWKISSISPVRR